MAGALAPCGTWHRQLGAAARALPDAGVKFPQISRNTARQLSRRQQQQHKRGQLECRASQTGKGFGKAPGGGGKGGGAGAPRKESLEEAETSRRMQVDSTKLLSQFLEAEDVRSAVQANIDSLSEDFFIIASTYMEMAKKEKNEEVEKQLEGVLRVAMEEKEKTLRPEIRLLNQLLRDKTPSDRLKTMAGFKEYIFPDGYFFSLLNRMVLDVDGAKKPQEKLQSQLRQIQREAQEQAKSYRPS